RSVLLQNPNRKNACALRLLNRLHKVGPGQLLPVHRELCLRRRALPQAHHSTKHHAQRRNTPLPVHVDPSFRRNPVFRSPATIQTGKRSTQSSSSKPTLQKSILNSEESALPKPTHKPQPISPARLAAFEILLLVAAGKGNSDDLLHSAHTAKLSPEDRNLAT